MTFLAKFGRSGRGLFVLCTLTAALLSPPPVTAQQSSAAINGNIKDSTGSVVEGATITLTDTQTGVSRTTVSNATGDYVFIDILPSTYDLHVTKTGFSSVTQQHITMQVNQTATYDYTLNVGSTQQSITVEASPVAIEASTSELGTVINEQAVKDLPLNGRNFTQLLTLTPGASPVSVAQNSGGGGGFAGNAIGSFSFPALNGQRNRSNMFLMDGVVDLGSFIGNYNVSPIVDSVQEFKVQSHNDLSEFGQAPGGIVNVATKAGTNSLHGSVWEFLRNDVFDARNFFLAQRNPLRQNQFGFQVGGPVYIPKLYNGKNRTFFSAAYEGYRQSQATQTAYLAPTAAQLGGDFSAISNTIYNPATLKALPGGGYTANPFPGNIIPSQDLNPVAVAYAKAMFPTGPSVRSGTNAADVTPTHLNQDAYQIRIDESFGEHDTLFGRVSHFNEPQTGSGGYTGTQRYANNYGYNAAIHETHTFGPSSVLDVFFGRNTGEADTGSTTLTTPPNVLLGQLAAAGMSPNFLGGFAGGQGPFVPSMTISSYLAGNGGGQGVQNTVTADNWMFGGNYTRIVGKHTIKMGATFSTNNTQSPIFSSSETFASTETQNPANPNGTGDALASFLLGLPDSAQRRNVLETEHGGWVNGVYLQDQIKVTSRLTLNLGVRWDVTLWPIYGQVPQPDAYVGDLNLNNGTYILTALPPACSATQGYPCIPGGTLPDHVVLTKYGNHAIYSNDYGNIQPRAGLAYRVTDKTAIRIGYGRFYDNWNSIIQLAQNYEGTWPDVGQLIANNLNHPGGTAATIADPFNQGSGAVVQPALTPFQSSGFVNWYVDPGNYKMPYADQWNVGVEQGLGANTVLSLAYVGSHDARLNQGTYGNTATSPGPGTAAEVAARRPYPYITPTYYDRSIGQSKYNAFQFRLQQRATAGLSYIISYTRSKSMDQGCSGSFGAEGCENQFPYNINLDRSVSGFDLPNIFSGSFIYDVPIGRGRSFSTHSAALDYVLGNWQLGGIVTVHSGVPFDVTVSNGDLANTGNVVERANLVSSDVYAHSNDPTVYLNTGAFAVPAPYTFGNLGRNALRTNTWKNVDLSLTRRFPIKEIINLEFRADAFNISNTTIFDKPDSTLGDANFGVISGIAPGTNPRQIQFSLKLLF